MEPSPTLSRHQLLAPSFNKENTDDSPIKLTLRQAQQLKRDLITRAITEETDYLLHTNFVRAMRAASNSESKLLEDENCAISSEKKNILFLNYFVKKYLLTFPFLKQTDLKTFLNKLELFQDAIDKANLSSDSERSDVTKRKVLKLKVQKILVLLFNNATPLKMDNLNLEEKEVKVNYEIDKLPEQNKLENNEMVKSNSETSSIKQDELGSAYFVDIVGVRVDEVKGTFMNSVHVKFIVMLAKKDDDTVIYTLKRFDDFKKLLKKVATIFPLKELPILPPKVKDTDSSKELFRENDRLTLRSVFRRLMADPEIASLYVIYNFLNDNGEQLTNNDLEDISIRKQHMLALAEDRKKYSEYITKKGAEYTQLWDSCKKDLLKPGGLDAFEKMLSNTSDIRELPSNFKGAFDWGKLNLSSFLYTFFCTTDDSARFYQALCSTHKLLPYKTISTILKYTNPTSMVKAIIDLLLAQPFGSTSLLQRILTSSLMEQATDTQKEIDQIEAWLNLPSLCEKIRNFVFDVEKRSSSSKFEEELSDFDRLNIIINDTEIGPDLTVDAILKYSDAKQWMEQFIANKNPKVNVDNNGNLYYREFEFLERLYELFILYTRKKDAHNISNLMFQGVTGEIMKELLAIFYGPLAQVYKDANVSDFIMKISLFINDLIEVIKQVQNGKINSELEGGQLQLFIQLVKSHEQSFYSFVHSVYKHNSNGLFQNLLKWMDSLLDAIRNGVIKQDLDLQLIVDNNSNSNINSGLRKDLEKLEQFTVKRKQRQVRNLEKKLMNVKQNDLIMEMPVQGVEHSNKRRNSVTNFGFGNVTLDDLRDLNEVDHFNSKEINTDQIQSQINANPSEPMLIWLKQDNTIKNVSEKQAPKEKENILTQNESLNKGLDLNHIYEFIKPKQKLNISQEPYPKNINTIPILLDGFYNHISQHLRPI